MIQGLTAFSIRILLWSYLHSRCIERGNGVSAKSEHFDTTTPKHPTTPKVWSSFSLVVSDCQHFEIMNAFEFDDIASPCIQGGRGRVANAFKSTPYLLFE